MIWLATHQWRAAIATIGAIPVFAGVTPTGAAAELATVHNPQAILQATPLVNSVVASLEQANATRGADAVHLSQIIIRPDIDIIFPGSRFPRDRRPAPRSLPQPPNALPAQNTPDCITLTVMARLAYMSDPYGSVSREVSGRQIAECLGRGSDSSIPQWNNRRAARIGSNWSYPSGQSATFSSSYNYPNGRAANMGSSWNYPDGRPAKFGATWYTPSGRFVSEQELLSFACGALGTGRCSDRLAAVQGAGAFWYELTLVELAWLAHRFL
ncbi:MAG: hypothetical protein KME20_23980 [Kaiparowitsia implicata GSE-PSE-MK54-09C]|jgi:hypothetical protein|nr:hypothetical protein [Kaiparowitsia implicata GSE-PSE-MK54-09C]